MGNWNEQDVDTVSDEVPDVYISIIIPARNEEDNIVDCLRSIHQVNYPESLYEIILIDDHSEDRTMARAASLGLTNLTVLELRNYNAGDTHAFKKAALSFGISVARGEYVVTMDADCIVQPNWLSLLAAKFESDRALFVAAPVNFYKEKNVLQRHQSLEMVANMGITQSGIYSGKYYMANGANMAFQKSAFQVIDGFRSNDHLASGDDMFTIQAIAKESPDRISYIKSIDATNQTEAPSTFRAFVNQRIRWATKSKNYEHKGIFWVSILVFLFCTSIIANVLLSIYYPVCLFFAVFQIFCKMIMDYLYLSNLTSFFDRRELMKSFIPSFFIYLFYVPVFGLASLFVRKYTWKGRMVR